MKRLTWLVGFAIVPLYFMVTLAIEVSKAFEEAFADTIDSVKEHWYSFKG